MFVGCVSPNSPVVSDRPGRGHEFQDDTLVSVWTVRRESEKIDYIKTAPLFFNQSIIFGYDTTVQSINIETGKIDWIAKLPPDGAGVVQSWYASAMILEGEMLYVQAGMSTIAKLNARTGQVYWLKTIATDFMGWGFNRQSISEDGIFISTRRTHRLLKLSKASGETLWEVENAAMPKGDYFDPSCWIGAPSYGSGRVYVGSRLVPGTNGATVDGAVAAYDAQSGSLLWMKMMPLPDASCGYARYKELVSSKSYNPPTPTADGDVVITSGFTVARLDGDTGELQWMKAPSPAGGISDYEEQPILVDNGVIAFNNGNGAAYSSKLDLQTGKTLWTVPTAMSGGEHTTLIYRPILGQSTVLKAVDENILFEQDLSTGMIQWSCSVDRFCLDSEGNRYGLRGAYNFKNDLIFLIDEKYLRCFRRVSW